MRNVVRIAKRRNLRPQPTINQLFGLAGFIIWLFRHLVQVVSEAVAADFMPIVFFNIKMSSSRQSIFHRSLI
jgi:hypothetical protein